MSAAPSSRVRPYVRRANAWLVLATLVLAACNNKETSPSGSIALAVSNVPASIVQGQSGTITITVTRTDPFVGPVDLSVEGLPSGMVAAFDPAEVPGGSATSTLTISPDATVAPGSYPLTVRGVGAGITDATAPLTIVVAAATTPTVAIVANPTAVSVAPGASATSNVSITRGGGFTGDVSLAVTGAPSGVTTTISPNPVTGTTTTSVVTVAADNTTAPGTYPLTVTATGTGVPAQTATITLTVPVPQGVTLTLNPTSLSIAAGASATSAVTIARTGGFTGRVSLSVTGAPTGMTVSFDQTSVTGTSATLTVAPSTSVPAGVYTLTVTGSATGVASGTATLSVTVTAAPSTSATFSFCPDNAPIWVAMQDGTGPWTRVTASANNTYSFSFSSGKGGIAYVTSVNGSTNVTVLFATSTEIAGTTGTTKVPCTIGGKTVNGTVAGLRPLDPANPNVIDAATIVLGPSAASASAANPAFQLKNLPNGTFDLIASYNTTTISGTTLTTVLNKLIIRRALSPADGSTLPVLDFGSSEAFAPATATATIGNLGTDQALMTTALSTANGTSASFFFTTPSTATSQTYYGVPDAQLAAGDIHSLTIIASPAGSNPTTSRFVSTYFRSVVDRTINLGSVLGTPTISQLATSPYLRLRAVLPQLSEYNVAGGITYSQGTTTTVTWSVIETSAYAGGAAYDVSIPDLSGVDGWNNAWGLTGTSASYTAFETGGTFNQFFPGARPAEGNTAIFATRTGNTP